MILLGLDILMKGEKGPADIKLSEGVVLLNGFIIPIVQIGHSNSLRKVVSAENVIIPPKSEIIVDVLVERTDKDYLSDSQEFLIEPNQKFIEKYPVLMAKPVRIPARKVPLAFANEENKLIDQMHKQGIIQKSNSPWSSPLLLIFKKMER